MKSVSLLQLLGVCAVSFLAMGTAQAGESCALTSLAHPAVSADAGGAGCGDAKRADATAQKGSGLVATVAPLVGSMAKTGIQTASSVMGMLAHEAGHLLDE